MNRFNSIRTRLTLWIVFLMALGLGMLGTTVYFRARAGLLQTVDDALRERAVRLSRLDEGGPDAGAPFGPPRLDGKRPPPPFGFPMWEQGSGASAGPDRSEGRTRGGQWWFAPRIINRAGKVMLASPDDNKPFDHAACALAFEGKVAERRHCDVLPQSERAGIAVVSANR
jgi:hypothetical protein